MYFFCIASCEQNNGWTATVNRTYNNGAQWPNQVHEVIVRTSDIIFLRLRVCSRLCVCVCGGLRGSCLHCSICHDWIWACSVFNVHALLKISFRFTLQIRSLPERLWCKTCNGRQRPCIRYKDLKRLIDNKLWLTCLFVCYLPCLEHDKRNLCEFLMNARMKGDRIRDG